MESKFRNTNELATYLNNKRFSQFESVVELYRSKVPKGRHSSLYQHMCSFERGSFPTSEGRTTEAFKLYLNLIGIPKQEQMDILALVPKLNSRKRESNEKSIARSNLESRAKGEPSQTYEHPVAGIDYTEINGRPAKNLAHYLNERSRKGGGMIIGQDPHTGNDWIKNLIVRRRNELSLDEVSYFASMFIDNYDGMKKGLNKSLEAIKQLDPKYFPDDPMSDITSMLLGLPFDEPKPHVLSSIEPAVEAVDTRLKILELEGYESAKIIRRTLNEVKDEYYKALNKVREEYHKRVLKHVE